MSVVANKWSTRATTSTDPSMMGRWSAITLNGKLGRQVTIFSAYRVCDQVFATTGPRTAFRQQYLIAAEDQHGRPNLDPRQQVLQDLESEIQKIRSDNHAVIIMIDANESQFIYQSKIAQWINRLSLVDPLTTRHGHLNQPPSVGHGSARIDFILTSPDLVPYTAAVGSLPHDFLIQSDHRPMFIDIDLESFLHGIPYDKISHSRRGIQSDNPKAVKKYQSLLTKSLSASTIELDAQYLADQQQQNGILSPAQIEKAKDIDRKLLAIKLAAEEKCRHILKTPWSPVLKRLKSLKFFWNSWLIQTRTHRDGSSFRRHLCPDMPVLVDPSIELIKSQLRKAQLDFKAAERDALNLRSTHLSELARMLSNTGRSPEAKIVTQLLRGEKEKALYSSCHRALHKTRPTPVTHVLISSPGGNTTTISDQAPMETAFTQRNLRHFSQADGTPFASSPLTKAFGINGTDSPATRLLHGLNPIDHARVSEATNAILNNLPLGPVPPIDSLMYPRELMKSYGGWRETTSTSPAGDHLGHDHAVLRKTKAESQDDDPDAQLDARMFAIKSILLNLAVQNTIVYDRWKLIVNAMIEKIPGRPLIEKFRVIHIIPSDFNMLMGILFGYRMMLQGEALNQFGEEQSGSRKRKDCQDVQLLKHCIFSCVRLSRSHGSTFNNDAKSCFDRIVMLLPSLLAQRLGMPKKVCDLFLTTLSQIRYHTKTTHGVSEEFHTTSPEHTIHGPGQGSRAAPAIWTIVSCFLLSLMKNKSQGAILTDPDRSLVFKQSSSGFVDDITHWNINICDSIHSPETEETIVQTTATLAQWWENLLHSSGGKLELSKCFYYTFHWTYDEAGTPSFSQSTAFPRQVSMIDSATGQSTNIEHKECSESHKTLGKLENPSGNYDDEAARIKDKADGFGHHVLASGLSQPQAHRLYTSMFLPSVCYGFSSGTLSIAQAERAQSHFTSALLPKLGYNRNIPRAVAFAEPRWGGAGLRHFFSEQGTKQVETLLKHLRTRSELGKALTIQLKWAQKISGLSVPILVNTSPRLPHMSDERWVSTMRLFLDKSHLSVHTTAIRQPEQPRENDRCIMDIATHSKDFTQHSIILINRCRIHLRATFVSDLTDASGTALTNNAISCIPDKQTDPTLWPLQPKPANQKPWKKFLRKLCSRQAGVLDQPLGRWLMTPSSREWLTYYNHLDDSTSYRTNNRWVTTHTAYQLDDRWVLHPPTPLNITEFSPDHHCVPVTRYDHDAHFAISVPHPVTIADSHQPESWQEFVTTLPPWEQILLHHAEVHEPILLRRSLIQYSNEPTMIVSDGSCKGTDGAFGWEIEHNHVTLASCYGPTTGNPNTPLRSECFGILSWAVFLLRYCEYRNIPTTMAKIRPYSDSKTAISFTTMTPEESQLCKPLRPDFDITVSLSHTFPAITRRFPMMFPVQHIKGHRKDYATYPHLRLLHEVDKRTKETRRLHIPAQPATFSHGRAFVQQHGSPISGEVTQILRWSWRNDELFRFFALKFRLDLPTVQRINWDGFSAAKVALPSAMQQFTVKLVIGWLPVGSRMKFYGNEIDTCHLCPLRETPHHLFQCSHRIPFFLDRHEAFQSFVGSIDTPPDMIAPLSNGILSWATSASQTRIDQERENLPTAILQCAHLQDSTGWSIATFGVMDRSWSDLIPDPHGQNTGNKWQSKVSKWLIEQAHLLWINRCSERHDPDPLLLESARLRETEAQIHRVYNTSEHLTPLDRHELIRESLDDRLLLPEPTNRLWAAQMLPLIYRRIKFHATHPNVQDIRQFFPAAPSQASTAFTRTSETTFPTST